MTRHQYGISRSFLRRHFVRKPMAASRNVGCFFRPVLFILCPILAVHVICEPAAKTKLQLLNCTQWTEQFLVEKEAMSSEETLAFAPPLLLEVLTASPKSHILTLLSRPPEASSVPSALKARLYTESECPRNSLTILPADRSHRRMRRSSPADTRYCPSGEIARSCIEPYKQT